MIAIILSFLSANSGILTILGMTVVAVITAIISGNKQKAYTSLYRLCIEAESLEITSSDKNSYVFNKAYSALPLIIRTFVSEDSIKYAIEFALTNLKKFSALKMGVTPEVVEIESKTTITEVEKIENDVKKLATEGKTEVKAVIEDVKNVVELVEGLSKKEIEVTGEKVISDLIAKDSTEQIVEDVEKENPEVTKAINSTIADINVIKKPIEELNAEIITNIPEIKIVEEKVEKAENVVIDKVEEVKTNVAKGIDKVEDIITPIIPLVTDTLPIMEKVVPIDVQEEIAKIESILAGIKKSNITV